MEEILLLIVAICNVPVAILQLLTTMIENRNQKKKSSLFATTKKTEKTNRD
ncbi:hypothetical protein ABRT01_05400 [Lentibacillus sp. L22]|uniref:hypothetical protein n=1 Tax=Lentibacillus sp. L22 TaxID=3163028 RepID=UPI0034656F18